MTIKEVLGALGSWEIALKPETPDDIHTLLGLFGHVAVVNGNVDVEAAGDSLLGNARYVGVLREKRRTTETTLSGSGMVFWLGDEDSKGEVIETEINFTSATLASAVAAVLPDSVTTGIVHPQVNPAARYAGKHQFQTPREALQIICDAFGAEFRVNGDGSVDVGTAAQLYNTEAPDSIVVRKGAGADMDLTALGGEFEVETSAVDYSTRILLLGQTVGTGDTPDETFATGSADASSVPYFDLFGNPVKRTRMISESSQTTGSVAARAQLQLNRFNRTGKALKVTAEEYEMSGNFVVGDNTYVYDPETGIFNTAVEKYFRGEVLHPDVVRVSAISWPVSDGHTVAFRTVTGAWIDLTPYVLWETGTNEITVGDLPKSLTGPNGNPVLDRVDAATGRGVDTTVPKAPSNLTLSTLSGLDAKGDNYSLLVADWDAPTQNTDNSALLDLSHYIVQYRAQTSGTSWSVTYSNLDLVEFEVINGLTYDVRVAAVDRAGNVGPYTGVQSIVAAEDGIAPAAPSDPVVTSYLGQLRIAWDGLNNVGTGMPADFNRVDVHVGTTSSFVASDATLVSSLATAGVAYATAPYGSTRYVRLIAVDRSGNVSASSGVVSGATAQVADGDVASLNVGKLVAGTMTADVVMGGRFATALTGARVEMNSLGFQKYNASNVLLVSITGTEALLTGTYKSAASGERVEISNTGTGTGEIQFFSATGSVSRIAGVSGSDSTLPFGGTQFIKMHIPTAGVNPAWNSIQVFDTSVVYAHASSMYNVFGGSPANVGNGGGLWSVYHASDKGTSTAAPQMKARFSIGVDTSQFYGTDDVMRFGIWDDELFFNFGTDNEGHVRIVPSAVGGQESAKMKFAANPFACTLKYYTDAGGANQRFEFRNATDVAFIPIYASAFTVSSDASGKDDIRNFEPGALDKIRVAKVKRYKLKPAVDQDGNASTALMSDSIGLIAQEAPAEVQADSGKAIDLYGLLSLTIAALQELDATTVKKGLTS